MKRLLIPAVLLVVMVAGCAKRQAVEPATGRQSVKDLPNDAGGYARDLAEPPAKQVVPDVEKNIKAGRGTDSRDPLREPDDDHDKDKDKAKDKAKDDDKTDLTKPSSKDTSGDSRWASVKSPVVAIQTNRGVFYLELWPDVAPKHVANFLKLTKSKFFDGIFIHRVEPGFVIQAGDPLTKQVGPTGPGVGTGGPGWKVAAEFSNKQHLRGTLSMARSSDPNSAGSQFFVCLGRAESLDGKYSVFGKVLGEGMDVVDKIKRGDIMHYVWIVHE